MLGASNQRAFFRAKLQERDRIMSTPKKQKLNVVEANTNEIKAQIKDDAGLVTVSCHLPHGLIFDDVPAKDGGTKSVEFPGLNSDLTRTGGILLDAGMSVAVQIPKEDWENIVRMHGRERAFLSYNGLPPCLMVIDDPKAIHNNPDVKLQKHGMEPIKPAEVQVESARITE